MEQILALKVKGNEAFVAKDYEAATESYTTAIKQLDAFVLSEGKADTTTDTTVALLSNRAACYLKLEGCNALAVQDCERLLSLDNEHFKGLFRLGTAWEAIGDAKFANGENGMNELKSSIEAFMRLLAISDALKRKYGPHLARVQKKAQEMAKLTTDMTAQMEKLVQSSAASDKAGVDLFAEHLTITTQLFGRGKYNQILGCESSLPHMLFQLLPKLLLAEEPALVKKKKHVLRGLYRVMQILNDNITLPLKPFSVFSDAVTTLLKTMTSMLESVTSHTTADQNGLICSVIVFLSLLCKHPKFDSFRKPIVELVTSYLFKCEEIYKTDKTLQPPLIELTVNILRGLTSIARGSSDGISLTRSMCINKLLISPLWKLPPLRNTIVGCVSAITAYKVVDKPTAKPGDKVYKDEDVQDEKLKEAESKFKNTCSDMITAMALHNNTFLQASEALSILLQSNPPLGIKIITGGTGSAGQKSFMERAQEKVNKVQEEKKIPGEDEKEEEAPPTKLPAILEQFLMMSVEEDQTIALAALEVLALASSDNLVRECMAKAQLDSLLYALVTEEALDVTLIVRCHAGLALSKLIAMGRVGGENLSKFQHEQVVLHMVRILREQEEENVQNSKQNEDVKSDVKFSTSVEHGLDNSRAAIESLSYLCLHIQSKKTLVTKEGGKLCSFLFSLAKSQDHALRYGLTQVIRNMTTSEADIKADYTEEIEQLRKIAQKGLPGSGDHNEVIKAVAGTAKEVNVVKRLFVSLGGATAIVSLIKQFSSIAQRLDDAKKELKLSNQPLLATDTTGDMSKEKQGMSHIIAESLATALLHLSTGPEGENTNGPDMVKTRGMMVQQGSLQALVRLYTHPSPKAKNAASLAMARIMITTNPHLIPKSVNATTLAPPLIWLVKSADHELPQFEATMALTNLASMSADVRDTMVNHGVWPAMRTMLGEDNFMSQRAALECMTNLINCEKVHELLLEPAAEQDLRFFLIFAQTDDDLATQLAATGALAMLSPDKAIMEKVIALEYTSIVTVDEGQREDLKLGDEVTQISVKRSGLTVLRNLKQISAKSSLDVQNIDMDDGVKARIDYVWDNLEAHGLIPPDSADLGQIYAPWLSITPK